MRRLVHIATVPDSLVFLRGQAAYMRSRGIETTVITSPGPALDAFAASEGVEAFAVPMQRAITPRADAVALARLVRLLRRIRPDLVHSHTPKGGLLGTTAAFLARVPSRIYHMRGLRFAASPAGPQRQLLTAAERTSCTLATQVLCVSHSLRDVALSERLCAPAKIRAIGSGSGQGVDATGRFNPDAQPRELRAQVRAEHGVPENARVLGFVGRIVRDKGVAELVAAWRRLRLAHPNLHLLVVGPFEPEDPIDPADRALLEADERVHLVGFRRDTERFYAAMDLVALPTYREGFPNVPLEAAAMRLPVVATKIPGCVDAVADGRTGTLVPARDASALHDAIERYLDDLSLARAHAEAGRARVLAEFRREAIWEGIAGVYAAEVGRTRTSG